MQFEDIFPSVVGLNFIKVDKTQYCEDNTSCFEPMHDVLLYNTNIQVDC